MATVLLVLALLAVVGATTWGFSATRADVGPDASVPAGEGWVDAGDAVIRLDAVSARDTGHQMPGMDQNLADPVPEGARRISATVTVAATAEEGTELTSSDFRFSAPGLAPTAPVRAQLGDGRLDQGTAMTVELVFDVPEETEDGLVLTFGAAALPLPGLTAAPEPVPVPTEPAVPADDHPHAPGVPEGHHEEDGHGH